MRLILVGRDEATKKAIEAELSTQYGFTVEHIYRPFGKTLDNAFTEIAEQINVKHESQFGVVETTLREAFGPTPFLEALQRRCTTADTDIVVSDAILADEVEVLQNLPYPYCFTPIIVSSTNKIDQDNRDFFIWHTRNQIPMAVINNGTVTDLKRNINNLVAAIAQAEGQASASVRSGLNNFKG